MSEPIREALAAHEQALLSLGRTMALARPGEQIDYTLLGKLVAEVVNGLPAVRAALAAPAEPRIDVERVRAAAVAVVEAHEAVRDALNGEGHPDEPHDEVLHIPGSPVYGPSIDCASCGDASYGAEDDEHRAFGWLRSALGMEVRPWEYPNDAPLGPPARLGAGREEAGWPISGECPFCHNTIDLDQARALR